MAYVRPGDSALLMLLRVVAVLLGLAHLLIPATAEGKPFNQPGTVQLTAPGAGGSYLTGQTITLTASAADADGIAKVSFFQGTTLIGESAGTPYHFNWNTTGLAAGTYSLTAQLLDNLGNSTTSAAVAVPLSAPLANQPVFYRAINLNGNQVVLDKYQWEGSGAPNYTTNGGTFTNTSATLSPATDAVREAMIRSSVWRHTALQLNLTSVPSGTYQVYLYVWEDSSPQTLSIQLEGRVVESDYYSGTAGTWKKLGPYQSAITDGTISLATTGGNANFSGVEVWQVPASNQAGSVALTSPAPNLLIATGQSVALAATATDADGVAKVEFYYGASKIGEDATSPYALAWNTTGFAGGPYQLSARVVDNAGVSTTSALVTCQLVDSNVSSLFYRGINLNGGAVTIEGKTWEAGSTTNATVLTGSTFTNTTTVFAPQPDAGTESMLRTGVWHWSGLRVNFPVANGAYLVYLYASEDNDPATFSLTLEGQTVLRDYTTGQAGWWSRIGPFQVNVTDGTINLVHLGGSLNLSGVELQQLTGASNQPPTLGLQAYWPFNSASTLGTDASGKGNAGTLHNAPTWVAGGRLGGSMEMADNTGRYMSVPGLNWQPTQFTVAWWLYPESYNHTNQMLTSGIGWGGFVFHTTPDGGVHVGTDLTTRLTPKELPTYTVKLYQWQHFAFTFDNGTAKFYRDGVLLASKTGMSNPLAWGGFLLGNSAPEAALHGLVDEVRIYNRALQDAEVSRTANFYTALTCTWKPDAATTAWNTATNWLEGKLPTSNDNVIVNVSTNPAASAKYPVLPGSLRINNLSLNTGAELDLQGHTLTVSNAASLYYATIRSNGGTLRSASTPTFAGGSFNGPTAAGAPAAMGAFTLHNTGLKGRYGWGTGNKFYSPATINFGVFVPQNHGNATTLGDIYYPKGGQEFFEDVTINNYGFGLVMVGALNTFHKKLDFNFISNAYWGVRVSDGLYKGEVKITNGSGGGFYFHTGNVFKQKLSLINPTSPISYQTYGNNINLSDCSDCSNTFEGPVVVTNTSDRRNWYTPVDITFGQSGGKSIFTPTASLLVGTAGFQRGKLLLQNCTFQSTARTTLALTAGTGSFQQQDVTNLVIGGGTYFTGPLTVTSPRILLNGGTFGGEATFTKTGPGADNSIGGNTFRRKATFTNQADGGSPLNLATQQDDIVQQ